MADSQDPLEELLNELNSVPTVLKQITAKCTVNMKAKLNDITSALHGQGFAGERPKPATKKRIKEMLAAVQKVKVKPEKGRGKDIVRLERLLDELLEIYPGKG